MFGFRFLAASQLGQAPAELRWKTEPEAASPPLKNH